MKITKAIYCTLIACLLTIFSINIYAQDGFSFDYAPSRVFKHRSTLRFDVPDYTQEFRLRYELAQDRDEEWVQFWNYPRLAINALYLDFGSDVLGSTVAILPEIRFDLKKWNTVSFNLQFGSGLAYVFQPFHPIDNPNNDALGSYFNNVSSLKFGIQKRWNKNWSNTLSLGIVHFSNGSSETPNAGLNIYGATLSFTYFRNNIPKTYEDSVILNRNEDIFNIESFQRWNIDIGFQQGFTQFSTPGGPTFGVQDYYFAGGYSFKKFLTTFFGVEYEYNSKQFFTLTNNFYTEKEASKRSKQTVLYLEQELRYGRIFNRIRIGYYLDFPSKNNNETFYKLTTGFYLPTIYTRFKPYVSAVLKAHSTTADYLAFSMGIKTEI